MIKKQATDIESFKLGYSRIDALLQEIDQKYALLKIKTKIDKVASCNDLSKILDEMTHLIYETQVGKTIRNTSDRTYLAIGRNARRANEVLLPYKDRLFTESSLDAVHEFELKINNIKRNLKNFQGWIDDKANSIINPKPKQVKVVTIGEIEKEVGHLSKKKTINSITQSPNVEIIKNDTIKTWPKLQQLPGHIDVEIKGIEQGETTDPESGSFKFEQGKTKNKVMFINSARGFVGLSNYLDQPLFAKVEGLIQWSGIIPAINRFQIT